MYNTQYFINGYVEYENISLLVWRLVMCFIKACQAKYITISTATIEMLRCSLSKLISILNPVEMSHQIFENGSPTIDGKMPLCCKCPEPSQTDVLLSKISGIWNCFLSIVYLAKANIEIRRHGIVFRYIHPNYLLDPKPCSSATGISHQRDQESDTCVDATENRVEMTQI